MINYYNHSKDFMVIRMGEFRIKKYKKSDTLNKD